MIINDLFCKKVKGMMISVDNIEVIDGNFILVESYLRDRKKYYIYHGIGKLIIYSDYPISEKYKITDVEVIRSIINGINKYSDLLRTKVNYSDDLAELIDNELHSGNLNK